MQTGQPVQSILAAPTIHPDHPPNLPHPHKAVKTYTLPRPHLSPPASAVDYLSVRRDLYPRLG